MTDWNQLREEFAPLVWSISARILKHREDAMDCFQDVFIEAIRRSEKEPVEDWGALLRWLTTRRAIDFLRRRRNQRAVELPGDPPASHDHQQQIHFAELIEQIRRELPRLPANQAEAFWLVCVEERSYEEVAELMKTQKNTVGVLVHRARQHFKTRLQALNPTHQQ